MKERVCVVRLQGYILKENMRAGTGLICGCGKVAFRRRRNSGATQGRDSTCINKPGALAGVLGRPTCEVSCLEVPVRYHSVCERLGLVRLCHVGIPPLHRQCYVMCEGGARRLRSYAEIIATPSDVGGRGPCSTLVRSSGSKSYKRPGETVASPQLKSRVRLSPGAPNPLQGSGIESLTQPSNLPFVKACVRDASLLS